MKKQIHFSDNTWVLLILVLSGLFNFNTFGQTPDWNKQSSMIYPEVAPAASASDGKIYVTGGSKDGAINGGDYGDPYLQIYDIASDTWTEGPAMPTARWMHGSAEVNSVIYCIGGGWFNPLNTNEAYDINSGTWTTKTPMPTARSSASIAAVGNMIYVIGGFKTSQFTNVNEMYDPATDTWTSMAPMPSKRCGTGTAVVNGKIYVIGGCFFSGNAVKSVDIYDPQTNQWSTGADMPSIRFGLVAASAGNKIYAMGGTPSNGIPSPGKCEVYDTETNTWEQLDDLPDSTQWAAGCTWADKIYLLGGEDMCLMTFPSSVTIHDFLYEISDVVGIHDKAQIPVTQFNLQASPNPIVTITTVRFDIQEREWVKVEVFNSMGIKVCTLTDGLKPAGRYSVRFNASGLPDGVYFCRLSSNGSAASLKMVKW